MFDFLQRYSQKVCRTLLSTVAQSTSMFQSTTSHGILGSLHISKPGMHKFSKI